MKSSNPTSRMTDIGAQNNLQRLFHLPQSRPTTTFGSSPRRGIHTKALSIFIFCSTSCARRESCESSMWYRVAAGQPSRRVAGGRSPRLAIHNDGSTNGSRLSAVSGARNSANAPRIRPR